MSLRKRVALITLFTASFVAVLSAIIIFIGYNYIYSNLPNPNLLYDREINGSVIFKDRNGNELLRLYDESDIEVIDIKEVPQTLIDALIISEDKSFYENSGYDLPRLGRCTVETLFTSKSCGGSTITQQLARNTLLADELGPQAFERKDAIKSIDRKIKELILAKKITDELTKEEILELYINVAPLGGPYVGFQAASKGYFGKDLQDLALNEQVFLVSILPAPGKYNPAINRDNPTKEKQDFLITQLSRIYEEDSYLDYLNKELEFKADNEIQAAHFTFYVFESLVKEYGEDLFEDGVIEITTTLDLDTHNKVQALLENKVQKAQPNGLINNSSSVLIDNKTREILSMTGSIDYFDDQIGGQFNHAIDNKYMGSLLKPFGYLEMVNQGYGLNTITLDIEQMPLSTQVSNYYTNPLGVVPAREALVKPVNRSSIYVSELIGKSSILKMMNSFGLAIESSEKNVSDAIILGEEKVSLLELANAYSTLARNGQNKPLQSVLRIEKNNDILFDAKNNRDSYSQIVEPEIAYQVNWALCDYGNLRDRFAEEFLNLEDIKVCGNTGVSKNLDVYSGVVYSNNYTFGASLFNNEGKVLSGTDILSEIGPVLKDFSSIYISKERLAGELIIPKPKEINVISYCKLTSYKSNKWSNCPTSTVAVSNSMNIKVDNTHTSYDTCEGTLSIFNKYLENSKYQTTYEAFLANSFKYYHIDKFPGPNCPNNNVKPEIPNLYLESQNNLSNDLEQEGNLYEFPELKLSYSFLGYCKVNCV